MFAGGGRRKGEVNRGEGGRGKGGRGGGRGVEGEGRKDPSKSVQVFPDKKTKQKNK